MPKNGWMGWAAGLLLCAFAPALPAASSTIVQAGARYTIDHWDTEEGLPNNEVLAITQTRDGYLWLGTLNGLVRFDGIHFEVFDESNTPGLSSSRIARLFEDSQRNLWIGMEPAGVAILKNGQITSLTDMGSGGSERSLAAICEAPDGAVWLYYANGDLWRYPRQGTPRPYVLVPNKNPSQANRYRGIIAEPSGPVWVGTDQRQCAVGPITPDASFALPVVDDLEVTVTNKLDFLLASQRGGYWRLADRFVQKYTTNHLDADLGVYPWGRTSISAACEDDEGNLVVGTAREGLWWFDAQGKANHLEGLSDHFILSLHRDHEGTLWVGTDGGGLNRVKRKVFDALPESRGLVVQSVCEDHKGGLWIGSNGGEVGHRTNGVTYFDDFRRVFSFEPRDRPNEEPLSFSVKAVLADRSDRIWVGARNNWGAGLFQLQNGRFQQAGSATGISPNVQAIHEDRQGRLWLGTEGGLALWGEHEWTKFTTREGLSSDNVQAIADDAEGNLWIGTRGGGLNLLRDGKFTVFHKADGLPSEDISSLYVDEEGTLWIGTFTGGLGRFQHGKWARYTKRDGLVSNSIGYLIEDSQGYLWMGSNAGLMRAPKKALNDFANGLTPSIPVRAYGKPDGLPTAECTFGSQPAACRTRDGKLWFPTIKGLVSIDPRQLQPNTNPPPVVIESVLIDGQAQNTNGLRVGWPQKLTIPAGKERLEIRYTSLNLAAADQARFRYRLQGHETAWTEDSGSGRAGAARAAHYSKLPSGQYRFQVKACNEDWVWNETGSTLALVVLPPFWGTWWFLSATAACVLGTIVGVVHYLSTQRLQRQLAGLKQQDALEKERARIARDIHDQLGASLTQVSLLGEFVESDKDSPAEVEAHARQICQTARDTTRVLDEIVWTVNPSNDTLDGLINYICKYAQEYLAVAGLRYRLDVPPQLPGAAIPPEMRHNVFLAAKEAVTNVVRHAKASAVWLRLKLEPAVFILEIEDNGRGLAGLDEKAAQTRNGLRNMRKRMEDIGGTFTMAPAPEGGTLVRLTTPLMSGGPKRPREKP